MQGFQVTFFTEEGRLHGHQPVHARLMALARTQGITGIAVVTAAQGLGRDDRLHSAHFIELADRPVEVTMAPSPARCTALFERLAAEQANLFYVRTPVAFGVVGAARPGCRRTTQAGRRQCRRAGAEWIQVLRAPA